MIVKHFDTLQDYTQTWEAMQQFTQTRTPETPDEIWCLSHHPVYTQGQAGKAEHILTRTEIPIVQSDRGGQITYHGPGQVILYPLLDLKRLALGVRDLVCLLEKTMLHTLSAYNVNAFARRDAPGVYTEAGKIGSVGLRVKRGCSYHGLALNVDMDLTPFDAIRPCGLNDMKMTQLVDFNSEASFETVQQQVCEKFIELVYNPRTSS